MGGGILQLFAFGSQDMYLTNNPQITFFKVVYRRHTNFSIQTFEHHLQDKPDFGMLSTISLHRNGDLATKLYVKLTVQGVKPGPGEKFAWVRRLGHALLDSFKIEIGGASIDKQFGTWLDVWYELAHPDKDNPNYLKIIGDTPEMTTYNNNNKPSYTIHIPIPFWFHRHYGLALPTIAIQYHIIKFAIRFVNKENLIIVNDKFTQFDSIKITDANVLIDWIFLDEDERKRYASMAHEYLIEQVQHTGVFPVEKAMKRYRLDFNHPTKELIWAMKNNNYTSGLKYMWYTNKDDWESTLPDATKKLLLESIALTNGPPLSVGTWEEFLPNTSGVTTNGKIMIINNSSTTSIWINTSSLVIGTYNITGKITANIEVRPNNTIKISNITSTFTIRDLSISTSLMTDTRYLPDDPKVVQFNNYGVLIDGSINPIQYSLLTFNNEDRFEKRSGAFFNYLQPEMHHRNTPADGINVYSFALRPEDHQPTGTSNLNRVEVITLHLWFGDSTFSSGLPDLNMFNIHNQLFVFAPCYNVLKVANGLTALMYNG